MRTLTSYSNIYNNYRKTGIEAHIHVRIPDMDLELNSDLKSHGTITRQVNPFGGLEQVSTLSLSNLELASELKFCDEASVIPKNEGSIRGAGRLISKGNYAEAYNDVRNATAADEFYWPTITAGQSYDTSTIKYNVYRGFLQFFIPSDLLTCEEATIFLRGLSTHLTGSTNIGLILVAGNWSSLGSWGVGDTGLFNDFTGWQVSGDYTDYITQLNHDWDTSEFITYSASLPTNEQCNHIRLNSDGLSAIESAVGTTIRFMLLSENDVTNTAPTGNEFVLFDAVTATLELRYNTKRLKNQQAYVYRYYGSTAPAYTSMLELYRGRIDTYRISNRLLELNLVKSDIARNIGIPDEVITEDDFPYCPTENIGKFKPIVYGDFTESFDHREGIASFEEESSSNRIGYGDFVRGYVYDDSDEDWRKILFAGHALKSSGNFVATHEGNVESFTAIAGEITSPGDGLIQVTEAGTATDFPYRLTSNTSGATTLEPVVCRIPSQASNTGVTNHTYAVDSDYTNWSELTAAGNQCDYQTWYPWGVSSLYDEVAVVIETEAISGYTTDKVNVQITFYKEDGTTASQTNNYINSDGQHVIYISADIANTSVKAIISVVAVSGFDPAKPCKYRNLAIVRGYSKKFPNRVYMNAQGIADDGSGTITGSASQLLENPSHILESFARDQIGMSATEIDTTALDSLATDLTDWELAFQISEQAEINRLINQLGEECKTRITRDEQDLFTAQMWDVTDTFPHSATNIPGDLDIFQESYAAESDGTGIDVMTRNPIMDFSLEIIKPSDIKNSFVLNYKKNYATGEYEGSIVMDNGAGTVGNVDTSLIAGDESDLENDQTITGLKTLCANSYTACNSVTQTLTVNADFIRNRATAVKLLQHLIETRSPVRHYANIRTRENPAIWIELGDMINIRHRRVYEYCGIPTAQKKKWLVFRYDHNQDTGQINLRAIEVNLVA